VLEPASHRASVGGRGRLGGVLGPLARALGFLLAETVAIDARQLAEDGLFELLAGEPSPRQAFGPYFWRPVQA